MPAAQVSLADLEALAAEGHGVVSGAAALGVSHSAVARACARHRYRLPSGRAQMPVGRLRHIVDQMRPTDAVEHLFFVIEELTGSRDDAGLWPDVHLTAHERAAFLALYVDEGRVVPYGAIYAALYAYQIDAPRDIGSMQATISKARSKISAKGFSIRNVWGQGYVLERAPWADAPWE